MMYKLYGDDRSGHCYKVQLVCSLLDVNYEWIQVDLLKQEQLEPDFIAISPQHKVPVLEVNGEILLESNAIIHYLVRQHDSQNRLIPSDGMAYAQMLQWQFYEQSQFQPPISALRWIKHYQNMPAERTEEYQQKLLLAQTNFEKLNSYLEVHKFLVAEKFSLADITLFAYAHIANYGGIEFDKYRYVQAWIDRVKIQNGFIAMKL